MYSTMDGQALHLTRHFNSPVRSHHASDTHSCEVFQHAGEPLRCVVGHLLDQLPHVLDLDTIDALHLQTWTVDVRFPLFELAYSCNHKCAKLRHASLTLILFKSSYPMLMSAARTWLKTTTWFTETQNTFKIHFSSVLGMR